MDNAIFEPVKALKKRASEQAHAHGRHCTKRANRYQAKPEKV